MLTTKPLPCSPQETVHHKTFPVVGAGQITSQDWAEISRYSKENRYSRGKVIFQSDAPASHFWFVRSGYVKMIDYTPQGRTIILTLAGPLNMFGFAAFEGGDYGCYAMAETDVTVASVPIESIKALMDRHPGIGQAITGRLSFLLHRLKESAVFAHEKANKRILKVLVQVTEQYGNAVSLTRREIGEMAGTSCETTIRIMRRMEKKGLIATQGRKIFLRDPKTISGYIETDAMATACEKIPKRQALG